MSVLNNINKIQLQGNEVNRVVKHYNVNSTTKTKTLVTVQAVEEAVNLSKIPCDFEFNKHHELNVLYGCLHFKESETTNNLYKIGFALSGNKFYYSNYSLKDVTVEKIYIPDILKECDTDKTYTCASPKVIFMSVPDNIKEIIISQNLSCGFKASGTYDIKILCHKIDLANPTILTGAKFYITGTFTDCNLAKDTLVDANVGEIYLTANFFKNTYLDELTGGEFGDFQNFGGNIYIEKYNLNTILPDTDLLAKLKLILNYSNVSLY